ncbi:unnamed protein product [Nezara viridula]|uniref:Uncharacterized protein n=1 Tax=Nezara viridula TaxID=85310 RepID=A0A9P0HN51_NEZVI|nr:unnamed protein product [Nezara viridula]
MLCNITSTCRLPLSQAISHGQFDKEERYIVEDVDTCGSFCATSQCHKSEMKVCMFWVCLLFAITALLEVGVDDVLNNLKLLQSLNVLSPVQQTNINKPYTYKY